MMARAITMEKDLPAPAVSVVHLVKPHFNWRYIKEYRLVEPDKRVQVRDIEQLAPPREVAKYASHIRHGDELPPVIVTADGWLVDGNTRTEAARKVGWDTFPAVMIDVSYGDAPKPMVKKIKKLGGGFNDMHGRGMSPANIARLIEEIADEDDKPRDLAREMHLSDNMVNTVLNAVKARRRARELDVKILPGTLSNSHLKLFGGKSEKYTGPVFKELLSLTQDARLTNPQTNDLMKRVDAADTEADRLRLLAAERLSRQNQIDQFRRTPSGPRQSPSRSGKLRQHLGFMLKETDPENLTELNGTEAGNHLKVLDEAIEKLQKIKAAQLRIEAGRNEKE